MLKEINLSHLIISFRVGKFCQYAYDDKSSMCCHSKWMLSLYGSAQFCTWFYQEAHVSCFTDLVSKTVFVFVFLEVCCYAKWNVTLLQFCTILCMILLGSLCLVLLTLFPWQYLCLSSSRKTKNLVWPILFRLLRVVQYSNKFMHNIVLYYIHLTID